MNADGGDVCVPNNNYAKEILVLDITYGAFITAIPFTVIATLNVLIGWYCEVGEITTLFIFGNMYNCEDVVVQIISVNILL